MGALRLEARIRSDLAASWEELLADVPHAYTVVSNPDELVFSCARTAAVGVRLRREDGAHVVALPAFASPGEISTATLLIHHLAKITDKDIDIEGQEFPRRHILSHYFERVVVPFIEQCVQVFTRVRSEPDGAVWTLEGAQRPYFLGRKTAQRLQPDASAAADGVLAIPIALAVSEHVSKLQRLGPPETVIAKQLVVTKADGQGTELWTIWDPREQTLLPPSDHVLVRESANTKIRIPNRSLADLVTDAMGSRFDELQWLLAAQDETSARRLIEHASTIGVRVPVDDR